MWLDKNEITRNSEVRHIALPTMDDAAFCYWSRAA
jgi:hypothetical protein